mgnify:CR=1 FL=1
MSLKDISFPELASDIMSGMKNSSEAKSLNPVTDLFTKKTAVSETESPGEDKDQDSMQDVEDQDVEDQDVEDQDSMQDVEDQDTEQEDVEQEDVEDKDDVEQEDVEDKDAEKPMSEVIEETLGINADYSDDETDSDEDDDYLQKFDENVNKDYILDFHPEAQLHNYEEVKKLATVKRNKSGEIIDPLHRTNPFLTKYERTRVLGQRAKQLDTGALSTVKIPETTIDGYLMALMELQQRKIPLIIRRPIPNGGFEYWKVSDLELLE